MSKSNICRLIIRESQSHKFWGEWHEKKKIQFPGYGKPTAENLSKWRGNFNSSLKPNGVNNHLGIDKWIQCKIEIYNQITGQIIAEYNPPMFEVIND